MRTVEQANCFLAQKPSREALEAALRNQARLLAEYRGEDIICDKGRYLIELPLSHVNALLEYEWQADDYSPEGGGYVILGVLVNGAMIEPDLFAPARIAAWEEMIVAHEWAGRPARNLSNSIRT